MAFIKTQGALLTSLKWFLNMHEGFVVFDDSVC